MTRADASKSSSLIGEFLKKKMNAKQPKSGRLPTDGPAELRIRESYLSIQGEGSHSGFPCYFIRTAGCDLRCSWCDSPSALAASSGVLRSISELCQEVPSDIGLIQITGGEPLLQETALLQLLSELHSLHPKSRILLETGGHKSLANIPEFVHIVMDIKLGSSQESSHDFLQNLDYLKPTDEIKFVIANRSDYEEARLWLKNERLEERFCVLFSAVYAALPNEKLAAWVLEDRLAVRFQLQLHKIIWGNKEGI